jgi:hypothetical protein
MIPVAVIAIPSISNVIPAKEKKQWHAGETEQYLGNTEPGSPTQYPWLRLKNYNYLSKLISAQMIPPPLLPWLPMKHANVSSVKSAIRALLECLSPASLVLFLSFAVLL